MPLNDEWRSSNERCFDYDEKAFLQKWKILNRILQWQELLFDSSLTELNGGFGEGMRGGIIAL